MSIFGSIVSKIFGSEAKAAPAPASTAIPAAKAVPASAATPTSSTVSPSVVMPSAPAGTAAVVDVNAVLTKMAAGEAQKLDWKHSIVDLMKLLDLDSSLPARKELAKELDYTGSTDDTAAMNIWLHRQVMHKLAENGGKVPEELKV